MGREMVLGSGAFQVHGFSDLYACLARCFNTSLLLGGGLKRSPLGERQSEASVVRVAKKDTPVRGEFVCDVLCTKTDHTQINSKYAGLLVSYCCSHSFFLMEGEKEGSGERWRETRVACRKRSPGRKYFSFL
ncbi:hypothetical protein QOT17_018789 [Balamuthia mandrillaris]